MTKVLNTGRWLLVTCATMESFAAQYVYKSRVKGYSPARMAPIVESGGVLGLTGNCVGRRQRVEGHPLVKRVKATLTADNNYALAA